MPLSAAIPSKRITSRPDITSLNLAKICTRSQPLFNERADRFQRASPGSLESTFPDHKSAPALPPERTHVIGIPDNIRLQFFAPSLAVCRGPFKKLTLVTMPKTSVHKNDGLVLWQYDIWPAGKFPRVQPEPEPAPMQLTSDRELGRSVLATDSCHHPGSRRSVDYVCHKHPFLPGVRILTPGIL
jgi:hypothetical protein